MDKICELLQQLCSTHAVDVFVQVLMVTLCYTCAPVPLQSWIQQRDDIQATYWKNTKLDVAMNGMLQRVKQF